MRWGFQCCTKNVLPELPTLGASQQNYGYMDPTCYYDR